MSSASPLVLEIDWPFAIDDFSEIAIQSALTWLLIFPFNAINDTRTLLFLQPDGNKPPPSILTTVEWQVGDASCAFNLSFVTPQPSLYYVSNAIDSPGPITASTLFFGAIVLGLGAGMVFNELVDKIKAAVRTHRPKNKK